MVVLRRLAVFFALLIVGARAPLWAGRLLDDLREQGRTAAPRIKFSGQSDVRFADGGPAPTPFSFNTQEGTGGVSTFTALDLHLFITAALSPRSKLFVKLLGTADDAARMEVEAMTLTTRLGTGWPVLEVGRFTNNFGRFAQRFLPMDNPLVGEPLLYTYSTDLPTSQIPASAADLLGQRGKGTDVQLSGFEEATEGQQFVSSSWFLNGMKLAGHMKKLRYSLAIANEPASGSSFFDVNDSKAVTAHLAYKPDLALGMGISASRGAYLEHSALAVPPLGSVRIGDFPESSLGLDIDYALGKLGFFGELVHKHWESPTIAGGLSATGFFVEPRYKVLPGLYVALRAEHLHFDDIPVGSVQAPWDFDVSRLELGLGYSIERDLRLKGSYQCNHTGGASPDEPDDNLIQVQLVGAF